MKINSKQLTGVAAAIEQSQSQLTDDETKASAVLDAIAAHQQPHNELLHNREMLSAERESLLIELDTSPQELDRIAKALADNQALITESAQRLECLKADTVQLTETLEQEQQQRMVAATEANRQLVRDVLHSDEVKKAWSVIEAYWDLSGGNQLLNELYDQLKTIDKEHVPMPELARYRGSQVLEQLQGLR